jgi:hypothetical protein
LMPIHVIDIFRKVFLSVSDAPTSRCTEFAILALFVFFTRVIRFNKISDDHIRNGGSICRTLSIFQPVIGAVVILLREGATVPEFRTRTSVNPILQRYSKHRTFKLDSISLYLTTRRKSACKRRSQSSAVEIIDPAVARVL